MERNKKFGMTPDQVVGLVDAEGTFFAASYERGVSGKYYVELEFKVPQMHYSKELLIEIQKVIGCGKIGIGHKKFNCLELSVKNIKDIIEKVIPFFEKYPLVSSKHLDFLIFKKIALLVAAKGLGPVTKELHLEVEGIRSTANNKRSIEEIYEFCEKIEEVRITDGWLAGFIEGDGTFQFNLKNGGPTLEIAQKRDRRQLLNKIKKVLGVGSVKPKLEEESLICTKNSKRTVHRYVISGVNQIIKTVIPKMDKFNFYSIKRKDYNDWKILTKMYKAGDYKTIEGAKIMQNIKENMNESRPERKRF